MKDTETVILSINFQRLNIGCNFLATEHCFFTWSLPLAIHVDQRGLFHGLTAAQGHLEHHLSHTLLSSLLEHVTHYMCSYPLFGLQKDSASNLMYANFSQMEDFNDTCFHTRCYFTRLLHS